MKKFKSIMNSLPVWTRPFVGLLMIALVGATALIWVPLVLGWIIYDSFFGEVPEFNPFMPPPIRFTEYPEKVSGLDGNPKP